MLIESDDQGGINIEFIREDNNFLYYFYIDFQYCNAIDPHFQLCLFAPGSWYTTCFTMAI